MQVSAMADPPELLPTRRDSQKSRLSWKARSWLPALMWLLLCCASRSQVCPFATRLHPASRLWDFSLLLSPLLSPVHLFRLSSRASLTVLPLVGNVHEVVADPLEQPLAQLVVRALGVVRVGQAGVPCAVCGDCKSAERVWHAGVETHASAKGTVGRVRSEALEEDDIV